MEQVTEQVKDLSSKFEDAIDSVSQPLKPYIPLLARFLIIVTFLEDSFRIVAQWDDQLWYLQNHRGFPWGLSHFFLLANVLAMLVCSVLVLRREYTEYAVGGLFAVVILQAIGYGLIFDLSFFLRNLSVLGGLLMVLSDAFSKKKSLFPGLPTLSESDRKKYFLLAGRVLLIFLFIGFIFNSELSLARIVIGIIGTAVCITVIVGFKAKWSATFLVMFLSIFNVFMNNWWALHSAHPRRDFLKYDFFQTLSIMGGLLLLVSMGPGGISIDEKKKVF